MSKIKNLLIFVLSFALLISISIIFLFIGPALESPTGFFAASAVEEESSLPIFRTYTKAVCSDELNFIVCQDALFANCEGIEYKIPEGVINGKGIFSKKWKDPRG